MKMTGNRPRGTPVFPMTRFSWNRCPRVAAAQPAIQSTAAK